MRTIILVFLYVILAILLLPVLFICYLGRWPNLIIIISKWALKLGEGVQLEVSGLENIDKKSAYVFMANHLSLLDGPLLFMLIPQPVRVILKKEAFRLPVIGQGMRQLKFIPVDRKKLRGGRRSIDRAVRKELGAGMEKSRLLSEVASFWLSTVRFRLCQSVLKVLMNLCPEEAFL